MNSREGKYHVSALGGAYRTCPTCGKIFFVTDRTKRLNFCKWSCMRKWDKDHPLTAHQDPVMIVRPKKYKKGETNGEA